MSARRGTISRDPGSAAVVSSAARAAILVVIAAWNEFPLPLTLTASFDYQTISFGIVWLPGVYHGPWGNIAAASVIVISPLVEPVLIRWSWIVRGIVAGALKGSRLNEVPTDWRRAWREVLEQAQSRAARIPAGHIPIACAFTVNLDRVARLDEPLLHGLMAGRALDLGGPRITRAETVDQLLTGIVQSVAAGDGIDLPVPAEIQDWLLARIGGRVQVGGTGAQAAMTLSHLGFPTLLHLTGRAPEQLDALAGPIPIHAATIDGAFPLAHTARADDPVMWHVSLEYEAGLAYAAAGHTAPAPNRVIVSHDPVNARYEIDPGFARVVADPATGVDRVLVSGMSQVIERDVLERVLADTRVVLQGWHAARPDLRIHLELGAMPVIADLARVLEVLAPFVDGIGLNADEQRDLLAEWGWRLDLSPAGLLAGLAELRRRFPAPRWNLHTRALCLTLTDGDPAAEQRALLFGSLVASTRARVGRFPDPAALAETIALAPPHPEGVAALAALGIPTGIGVWRGGHLVAAPAPLVEQPAAAVGLGDSYTGGVLAMFPGRP